MEDVQYMINKGEKETYIFYVDSINRDKINYPSPNEYEIKFNAPFKNVYSIEVIDAEIPRTEYCVELFSNRLTYRIGNEDWKQIEIEPLAPWIIGATERHDL